MLGIPYALKHDAHVQVDVLYSRMTPRQRPRSTSLVTAYFWSL